MNVSVALVPRRMRRSWINEPSSKTGLYVPQEDPQQALGKGHQYLISLNLSGLRGRSGVLVIRRRVCLMVTVLHRYRSYCTVCHLQPPWEERLGGVGGVSIEQGKFVVEVREERE